MANESTKWLYEQLKGKGYNVGKDVDEFDGLMRSNADSRQWAYDTAKNSGLNVGKDIDEFSSLVGGIPAVNGANGSDDEGSPNGGRRSLGLSRETDAPTESVMRDDIANAMEENERLQREAMTRKAKDIDARRGWDSKKGVWDNFVRIVGGGASESMRNRAPKADTTEHEEEIRNLVVEHQVLEDTKKRREAGKLRKSEGVLNGMLDWRNNSRNIGAGMRDVVTDKDVWLNGVINAQKGDQLIKIDEKIQRGDELTDSELRLAHAAVLQSQVESETEVPHGYTAGQTTAEMAPFMAQMALNPANGAASALAKGVAKQSVKRFGKKAARRIATGVTIAGEAGESAVLANTLQAPSTIGDIKDRYVGNAYIDGDGQIAFDGAKDWSDAIYRGEGSAVIENYTELLGNHFGLISGSVNGWVKDGVVKLGGGKLLDQVSDLVSRIGSTKWAQAIGNIEKRAQWNGVIGEMLEEEAGIVLNSMFVGDNSIRDLVDSEQQIDIALGVGLFGGFVSGVKTAGYPVARYKARRDLNNADIRATELLGKDWEGVKGSIDEAEEGDLSAVVASVIAGDGMNTPMQKAVVDYARALMTSRGYNISSESARMDGMIDDNQMEFEDSFESGYSITGAREMNDTKLLMERRRQRLASALSEDLVSEFDADPIDALSRTYDPELRGIACDYVNARAAYDGMIQRVRDDIDGRIARSDAMIESRVNRGTGMITGATLKAGDRQVYIVNGVASMFDDGSGVDASKSSESLIVRDAVTNDVEFVDPTQILSVAEAVDAGVEMETARERIRMEMAQEAAGKVDGVLSMAAGERYPLLDSSGVEREVTVVGPVVDENGMAVDGMVEIMNDDGSSEVVESAVLQAMADAANERRIALLEEERDAIDGIDGANGANEPNGAVDLPVAPTDGMNGTNGSNEPNDLPGGQGQLASGDGGALSRIGVDERGEPLYDQADPDMAWDALVEQSDGDEEIAMEVANDIFAEKEKAYKDAEKALKKVTDGKGAAVPDGGSLSMMDRISAKRASRDAAAKAREMVDVTRSAMEHWQMIAGTTSRRKEAEREAEAAEQRQWEEAKGRLDKRVRDVSERYRDVPDVMDILSQTDPRSIDEVAAWVLSRYKVLWESRRNEDTGNVVRAGVRHHAGIGEGERRKLFGLFASEAKGGRSIENLAEDVFEEACGQFGVAYDNGAALDALIDVIKGATSKSDISNYIINNRISQAESEGEAVHRYYAEMEAADAEAMEHHGMSDVEWTEFSSAHGDEIAMDDAAFQELMINLDGLKADEEYGRGEIQESAADTAGRVGEDGIRAEGTGVVSEEWSHDDGDASRREAEGDAAGSELVSDSHDEGSGQAGESGYSRAAVAEATAVGRGDVSPTSEGITEKAQLGIHERVVPASREEQHSAIKRIIDFSKKVKDKVERAVIGGITKRQFRDFAAQGIDIDETWVHSFESSSVVHNQKRHGDATIEGRIGQLPITMDDYIRIPDILESYDRISKSPNRSRSTGNDVIIYEKDFEDGYVYYLEEKRDKRKSLSFQTMYKKKKGTDSSDGLMPIASPSTPMAPSDNFSSKSEDKGNILRAEIQAESDKNVGDEDIFSRMGRIGRDEKLRTDIRDAEASVDTDPTDAQKEAGNYRKGHVKVGAFDISIENPKGSVRRGKDADGKQWETTMTHSYGYIRGTEGVDGDHVDVYLSDTPVSGKVFVVDQYNPDGSFDEHKVMLGFNDRDEAFNAYLSNYESGWENGRRLDVTGVSHEDFETWVRSSKRKRKPFADYVKIKSAVSASSQGSVADYKSGNNDNQSYSLINVVRDLYSKGKEYASRLYQRSFFNVAKTPEFMKTLGLTGNNFTIRYGVIARHFGKDGSHDISEDGWEKLPDALTKPFAITKLSDKDKGFRLYTTLQNHNGEYIVVGVDVKNVGRDLEVNAIATVFGRRDNAGTTLQEEIIYTDKNITPEQQSLLDGPNSHQYTAERELSKDKVNALSANKQTDSKESSDGYRIEPKPYTNKHGKTLDTYLVTFNRDFFVGTKRQGGFSKQEKSSLRSMAKDKKGWYDKETGGWMLRSREDAEVFARTVMSKNSTQLSEEAPLSLDDMQSATKQASEEISPIKLETTPTNSENSSPSEETPVKEKADKEREEAEQKLKDERNIRLNPDGSTTETIIEGGTEIAVTKGDFIPGVRPAADNEKKAEVKKRPGKSKPKPGTDGGLFDIDEKETASAPSIIVTESRPAADLMGDSSAYQDREAQTAELVEEIGTVIESRVTMLHLDAESVKPLTMTEVKKIASKHSALKYISDTDLQELVELAMTQLTRSDAIVNVGGTAEQQRSAYDHIVNLYQIQPSLNARDSERLIKQQYSTPTPFGYVMGQFVRAGGKAVGSMLEPSAGNGALTITVHPSLVHVNDIDEARLANLRKLGYGQVTAQDALLPFTGDKVDVVMTNPPFGTVTEKVYDGVFHVSSLEGQMAINALDKMKDDGRAAIVIGGNTNYRTNGSMNPKDAAFFGYLYSHYNVADVINISGKSLYSRNGTGYDVRMILIDGRKTGEFQRVFPPVKAKARAEQVTTFDELYKRVQDDIQQIQQVGSQSADVQREPATTTDGTAGAPIRSGSHRPNSGTGQRPGTTSDTVGDSSRIDSGQSATVDDGSRAAGVDNAVSGNAGSTDNVPQPKPRQSRSVGSGSIQNGTGRGGSDGRGAATSRPDSGTERLAVKTGLGDEKVPYPNQSGNGFTLMSVVPAAQAQALQKSLGAIGDVDQYLVDELGYSSKEELYGYLAAEQIDSVALAIHQMNNGNAFIIGDMTGVGKGRQGAALIRYGVKQGKVPIYFTQKPTLFTDNYRDLADIGSSDLRPFIIASNPKDANIVDGDGDIVHKLPSKKEQERVFAYIMEHGTLPDEYDYVLTTYDQIKNGTAGYVQNEDGTWNTEARKLPKKSKGYTKADYNGQTRRDALAKLAEGNIAILDESHTVGGDSGCGRYMQMLTSSAGGVTFLSATFAKRADNMPIYAQRTAIAEAEIKASELIDAIMKGGVTLQEIMSKQLVESGQMIRRERSFEGVTIDWLSVEEETDRRQRAQFDEVAAIFNAIRNFQDDYITPIIDAKDEAAAERGATVGHTQGTKDMGVKNVPFASKMYNLVNQLLFALKVDAVADRVVENLRNGYKPVISFTNTMEGFLSSAPKGVAMDDVPNFSLTLMRALDGVMRFTEKDANENTDGGSISLSELSAEGQNAYNAIRDKITNLSADLPISPMDAIRMKIEEAGYSVAEITGRTMQLNRTKDGKYIVETRKDRDKKAAMRDFNSGKLDVLMINKSGSTGISLHASSKFEDQRQRVMVFAQFQSDINDEVQMRGRIDRSGQVTRGRYEYIMSTIPAEQRIQMMFKAKLKSLDANTTSSQKSKFNEMEIVDYLNKYGDEVVWEYMKEHPELEERLGDPLDMLQEKSAEDGQRKSKKEDTSKKTGCAGKISRYLAFLSVDEQDEIFKEITEAYRVKIQRLDDAGENDLEITTMPLRAETNRKQIWHDGVNPGSGNAFADNTYVEEVEVDVLKKPMKRDEIIDAARKLAGNLYSERNGVMDWEHYAYNKGEEIHQFYQSKADEALDKLEEAGEARIAKAREKAVTVATKARGRGDNNFTDAEIQSLADTVANEEREKEELKQNKRHNEIMGVNNRIQSLLNRLRAGSIYVVPQDLKQGTAEMFSQTFGSFVGFKFNKSYTLGSSTAIFATLDGRRKVELALSDPAINTIISATEMTYRYSPKEINAITIDNWDSKVPTQTRQKRYIITGNLLQALVDTEKGEKTKGNLISYSTIDGETRQGILMGENFKLTDLRNSVSLSSRLAQIREGKAVVSENGDVQISKEIYDWRHGGKYELRVPKSKQRGGIYTMHPELLKLVEGNNFITKGGNMVAYVTGDNIAKVVDMLSRAPFNLTVLQESKLTEAEDEVRYRIEEVGERIEKLFEEAIAGNLKGKPVKIGKLTEAGREYLEKLSGISFKKNVSFVLNPSDLMHIYRGHFGKNEKDKGQNIPLDMRDIRNLANVISAPDKIIFLKEGDGLRRNMFYFFKEAENGTYNLMEIYSDRKGNLTAKTFYKTRKDAAQRVMDIKKSLLPTSETYFGAILSDKSGEGVSQRAMPLNESSTLTSVTDGATLFEGAKLPKFFELSTDVEAESLERNGEGAYSDAEVSMENDPWSKAWGESLRSKREEREFARRERRRMVEHIGELADKLNLRNVEIVTDSSGLEGRKARAKGFFDKRTGKITVVIPNNVSVADVEQTLLHEAVAHYGLRQLLGEHFDEFLDKVYEAAEDGIKEQIDLLATRNGWNRRVATEEYLAGLAEKTDFSDRLTGWFTKVKRYFVDMLRKIGFKHLSPGSIGDNELRYILWRSYENLANPGRYRAFEWEAQDVVMKYSLGLPTGYREIEDGGNRGVADSDGLDELNERFNEELEMYKNGELPDNHRFELGMPSDYLKSAGFPMLPISMRVSLLSKKSALNRHPFEASDLNNLVHAIRKPIAIFTYTKDDMRNLIVDVERDGKQFLVGVTLNYKANGIEINSVSGLSPKDSIEWLKWIQDGKAIRIDKKSKVREIIDSQRTTNTVESERIGLNLDYVTKIVENFENPAIREQNNNAEGDEDVRFRDGDFTPRDRAIAAQQYERMLSRGSWQFREATQDSMLGLKSLYEAVLNGANAPGRKQKIRIEDVAGYENAYLYENRMSSANNGEQHQYFSRFMKPLLESIHKLCGSKELDRRILTDYMIAKHGLERNEYMRKEAASNGEDTERDFAGLCGLTGEEDWRVAETVARQMADDYEADHDTAELWENVKKATNATLEKIYLSGLISEDTYNKVLGMYDFYIPLRGWDETTSDEVYGYLTSKDGPLMGNVFKTARGRNSKADDPIATLAMMADDAIRQGNRNIMKQRFLNFVHGNPSDLVSVNEMWLQHNDVTDEWEPVFADLQPDMTHGEVESEIAKFEAKMEALRTAEPDKYKKGRDARNIPYKVVRGNLNEHQVLVKRNGRTYVMTINGNPRAAQALNGLTNPNVETGGVIGDLLKLGEYVNRHLSAFYTTRNPDFVVSNFLRDMLYSNCMTWVKENPRYALRFHKNFGKVNPLSLRRLLSKWEKDRLSDSNYLEKMFKEFMLNGGETGYTSVKDIGGHKRTVAKELKKINKRDIGHKSWRWLGMQLDLLNRSAENCARFAAFLTSREMGRTLDRSIHDAKEISVNFNKKGSGGKFVNATGQKLLGKIGSYLGGGGRIAFVFWNAGIQGMTNFGRAAKRNPGKAIGGAAALFTLGYVIPLLAQMLGGGDGDDDDKNAYYNLPEYVRRSNICFKAGEQWITIPLPIEYRAIYGMGELACGVISGNERYGNSELARQMAAQISQIMPLDMLEGGGGISPFIPSAFKPYTEAYIMNKGWTGLPVYKDTPYNKNDPEWTKAYQSADQHLVEFTKWVNETTGGDDYKKGILDINPAKLEYLLSGTFGGVVSTTGKLKKMGETALSMREFEWRNMLLANRVIKSGDERTANRKLQNEYFKYLNEYEETNRLRKKYEHAANDGILGYAERADFLYNSAEYLRYGIFEEYKPDIDAIREGIKAETDPEAKKELENELFATMRELVDKLHNVDK